MGHDGYMPATMASGRGERTVRRSLHYSSAAGSQTMGPSPTPALTATTKTMHGNPDGYDTDLNTAIPICDARGRAHCRGSHRMPGSSLPADHSSSDGQGSHISRLWRAAEG